MKTSDYCLGVALFKENHGSGCSFVKSFPENLNSDPDFELIYLNALNFDQKSCIYAFTISETRICYAITFLYQNQHFTIVILSNRFIPFLYESFLRDTLSIFSKSFENVDPEMRLEYVYSTITSWKVLPKQKEIQFFSIEKTYTVNKKSLRFQDYDPFKHFSDADKVNSVWRALFLGKGVLVIAKDPHDLLESVFSIASITAPVPFCGKMLITTCIFDPRLENLDGYELVGILAEAEESVKRKFEFVLHTSRKASDFSGARDKLYDRSRRLKNIFLYLMDRLLIINPFNDLLCGPWVNDTLEYEMNSKKNRDLLNPAQIRAAEKTETVKQWRHLKRYREAFRSAFLSTDPQTVFSTMSLGHLHEISPILDEMSNDIYKDDSHMKAVIKQYRKILSGLVQH